MARERPATRRGPSWDERALLSDHVGMRWWAAVSLALSLTAAGAFADIQRLNRLGIVFQACYFVGCLLAVVLVQRKGLFGPMVQPPLILALTVPSVVLMAGSVPTEGGSAAAALAVGTPLINGFPTMATTTGVTLAVGFVRLFTQRRPTGQNDSEPANTPDPGAEPDAARPPARPARQPEPEPLTEPVPRVTDPAPRYETDRPDRRRRQP